MSTVSHGNDYYGGDDTGHPLNDPSSSNGGSSGGTSRSQLIAGLVILAVGLSAAVGALLTFAIRRRRRERDAALGPAPDVETNTLPRNINTSSYRRGSRWGVSIANSIPLVRLGRSRRIRSPPPPYLPGVVLPEYPAQPTVEPDIHDSSVGEPAAVVVEEIASAFDNPAAGMALRPNGYT